MSGPLVRSSYRAGRLYAQAMEARGEQPARAGVADAASETGFAAADAATSAAAGEATPEASSA